MGTRDNYFNLLTSTCCDMKIQQCGYRFIPKTKSDILNTPIKWNFYFWEIRCSGIFCFFFLRGFAETRIIDCPHPEMAEVERPETTFAVRLSTRHPGQSLGASGAAWSPIWPPGGPVVAEIRKIMKNRLSKTCMRVGEPTLKGLQKNKFISYGPANK